MKLGSIPIPFHYHLNHPVTVVVLMIGTALASLAQPHSEPILRRFPDLGARGAARAVQVADMPLAHTGVMLGWNENGQISGDARRQALQALKNVAKALQAGGASIDQTVKVHFYVKNETYAADCDAAIAEVFAENPVPAAFLTSDLTDAHALIGVDAVAAAPSARHELAFFNVPGLPVSGGGSHVGLLPPGRRVYFSGQAEKGNDIREATRATLVRLEEAMGWIDLPWTQVAQVKVFLTSMDQHAAVAEEVSAKFAGRSAPPCVIVERGDKVTPIEIDIVAAGSDRLKNAPRPADGLSFLIPPGFKPSTRFAYITLVEPEHPLIFIAGLYARSPGTARHEWLDIFGQLGDILWETGSSIRYQVKGNYYSATAEARRLHTQIRDVYFDPVRPPASSGMLTRGSGRPNRVTTIDMIAIPTLVPR